MTDNTPDAPNTGPAKKPVTRKTSVRKPASKPAPATSTSGTSDTPDASNTADASPTPVDQRPEAVVADAAAVPETAQQDAIAAREATAGRHDGELKGSVLDGVRGNPAGPLAAGLVVAIAVGLLLSVLVPSEPSALALIILGTLLSAAVGFTVRYLSILRNVARQVETLVVTVIGVHVMAVTGMVGGSIPGLSELGIGGPGFNEALLVALGTPPVATGSLLAGVVAAIIVGWKPGNRVRG